MPCSNTGAKNTVLCWTNLIRSMQGTAAGPAHVSSLLLSSELSGSPGRQAAVKCCQGIARIEGLDACPALEELWVAEAALACISGLDGSPRLRRLFLHSNRIPVIEGLDALTVLEVLVPSDTLHVQWPCAGH